MVTKTSHSLYLFKT